jgi:signal transduction histidine kinase
VNPNLPTIYTDPWKLKAIVKNLIENAVKFTESSEAKVVALASGEGVEIRVEDTGIGIPKDSLSAIFEPFRQFENVSTQRFNGTGLGLHIVKRLLDLVGGQVTVESEVGHGSTFWVLAPTAYNKIGQNDTQDTNASS